MLFFFKWENRKIYVDKFIDNFCEILTRICRGDSNLAGWITTVFLHHIPLLALVLCIIILPVNSWEFYLLILIYFLTYLSNLYSRGCVCYKIERRLFNDKTWYGLYNLLELLGMDLNTKIVKKVFFIWASLITLFILLKIYLNKKK